MPDIEMCSCWSSAVVRIHGKGTYCGDMQHERLADALAEQWARYAPEGVEHGASAVLDALRKEPAPAPVGLRKELEWLCNKLTSMVDAAMEESWVRVADKMEAAAQPAADPEPFELKDIAGDEVRVNSLPGAARISVAVYGVIWLDPDEADQLADALKAHAAARRAEQGQQA